MMRIITGRARGTRLYTLEGEATRPTSERTKEAIFSSLGESVVGSRVLDLFAGSGQMGLEALSRGARSAVFCERSRDALAVVKRNLEKTRLFGAEVIASDALIFLKSIAGKRKFDLVFLDPPYDSDLLSRALALLWEGELLTQGATVVCESRNAEVLFQGNDALASAYRTVKSARYGIAVVTYLSPVKETSKAGGAE